MLGHGEERMYYRVSAKESAVCLAARNTLPLRYLGAIALSWEVAGDDARFKPMTTEESGDVKWRFDKGSPTHRHGEAVIDGCRIHVDQVSMRKYGPGRSICEVRVWANGALAGRAVALPAARCLGAGTIRLQSRA